MSKTIQAPTNVAAYIWAMILEGATDEMLAGELSRVMRQSWPEMPVAKIERASMVCARASRRSYEEAVANA